MKSTYHRAQKIKLVILLIFIFLSRYGYSENRYTIKLINNTNNVVLLQQSALSHWEDGGELDKTKKVTVPEYQEYSWSVKDSSSWNVDINAFNILFPQQAAGKKNYATTLNFAIRNPSIGASDFIVLDEYTNFKSGVDEHNLILTINPNLTIQAEIDDNTKSWKTDSPGNHCILWSSGDCVWSVDDKKIYDDVYGSLISLTPYDYFKTHPETLNSNINLVESTHDVQLISHGHLKIDNSYTLIAKISMNNNPKFPMAKCTLPNNTHEMIFSAKQKTSGGYQSNLTTRYLPLVNTGDQLLPDLSSIIRDDFETNFPLNSEKFWNWTGASYSKTLGITNQDLNARKYSVASTPKVVNSILILDSGPVIPTSTIVTLTGELDNSTPISQNMTTASYSKNITVGQSQTITNGWQVSWKANFKIPVIGGSEISGQYSGNVADAVSYTISETLTVPSQTISVPSGCVAKSEVIMNQVAVDSDYSAYGILDKNMLYKMTTPWSAVWASGTNVN